MMHSTLIEPAAVRLFLLRWSHHKAFNIEDPILGRQGRLQLQLCDCGTQQSGYRWCQFATMARLQCTGTAPSPRQQRYCMPLYIECSRKAVPLSLQPVSLCCLADFHLCAIRDWVDKSVRKQVPLTVIVPSCTLKAPKLRVTRQWTWPPHDARTLTSLQNRIGRERPARQTSRQTVRVTEESCYTGTHTHTHARIDAHTHKYAYIIA